MIGGSSNCDAYHITSPHPEGLGAKICMETLLRKAGIRANQIDYINAHATGTQIGDKAEMLAIQSVFGGVAKKPFVSSTKGATGHLLGAAGALEAGICAYAIKKVGENGGIEGKEIMPPTLNLEESEISFGFDLLAKKAREGRVNYCLSNSFGFGGVNVSLLFGRVESIVCEYKEEEKAGQE